MNQMQENTTFKPLYYLTHSPINVHFSKNSDDFVVREIPIYEPSGDGEHLLIQIQKKDLDTKQALQILSEVTGAKMRDFGYAGLKDKQGMTTQFITLPRKFEGNLNNFSHDKIKILSVNYHKNKLKIGHLKGNSFFIRLKKVMPSDALKLNEILNSIDKNGFANYFGYQRFGKFQDNAQSGLELLQHGTVNGKKIKNPKMKDFLVSAYQSELFNKYVSKRIEISRFVNDFSEKEICDIYKFDKDIVKKLKSQKQFFKLLPGEVLGHYPFGKCFLCEDLDGELQRFLKRDLTSCGLLIGSKAYKSVGLANEIENEIYKQAFEFESKMNGGRRFSWSYVENLSYKYNEETAQYSISFGLQKGSYATVVLEEILHKDIIE
ncbi:tRNA pseudouridine(13) synthase TruD [Campylobacter pinnipediorum]|uniref:tRNA pseudouridine(13) synthase TruD n=1 Tax=Campylobacter pinnipediorum TaxID=1965231 RepID=UPI001E52B192|nr:tRNA pseudouridine(13) synthase TruD [Campylobacter pinnipediorum]